MKRFISSLLKRSSKGRSSTLPYDRKNLVREATQITLDRYSKTFKDLALYDRTEKTTR